MIRAKDWKLALFEGALLVLFGFLAMSHPIITTFSLAVFVGVLLMISGAVMGFRALQNQGQTGFWITIASALLFFVVGLLMLTSPVIGVFTLTGIVTAFFVLDALVKFMSLAALPSDMRSSWILLSGVLSLVLAVLVWSGWPSTALWFLGFLFGIHLVMGGIMLIVLALDARKA